MLFFWKLCIACRFWTWTQKNTVYLICSILPVFEKSQKCKNHSTLTHTHPNMAWRAMIRGVANERSTTTTLKIFEKLIINWRQNVFSIPAAFRLNCIVVTKRRHFYLFFFYFFLPQGEVSLSALRDSDSLPVLRVFHCERCRIRTQDQWLSSLEPYQWATTSPEKNSEVFAKLFDSFANWALSVTTLRLSFFV